MAEAIATDGDGFVVVAQENDEQFLHVLVLEDGRALVICDPADLPIGHSDPVPVDQPDAALTVAQQLAHLARFRTVQNIVAPDGGVATWIQVKLEALPARGGAGSAVYRPGEEVKLAISNRSPANLTLNISVLDLASDWSITQVHTQSAAFEVLDPGQTIPLEFGAYLPAGERSIREGLIVFATICPTDFLWMEMGPLGSRWAPPTTRKGDENPLDALHDQCSAGQAGARHVLAKSGPRFEWTVTEVTVIVEEGEASPEGRTAEARVPASNPNTACYSFQLSAGLARFCAFCRSASASEA